MTPWVLRLLVANVLAFVAIPANSVLYHLLTLFPPAVVGMDSVYIPAVPLRPWGLLTYMFLHAGFGHLFFNMLALFFFGPRLEARLGGRGFLGLYLLSGLGGAVLTFLLAFNAPVIGASGAVFGVMAGYARYWPHDRVLIWGIVPVPVRILVAFLVATSIYSGMAGTNSGVAHFAHLGGLGAGWLYLWILDRRLGRTRRKFVERARHTPSMELPEREAVRRWTGIDVSGLHELNRAEVEALLRKVKAQGPASLTPEERAFLDRMAGG
ncbi:MAG: rhomboid family intramembrane serine protease [Gemmatimonadetes bacterium]|nr:MAG: rhomboid family intramembrane serine protease [Gemmatimonadota bacterium]